MFYAKTTKQKAHNRYELLFNDMFITTNIKNK